ncbi:hypothetical protein LTR62_005329 [Meristemomyces frigidus]|uniref:ABM domain-containing protein n=1 Tax=Meristemomyces frigidus TaxID=1508187 RepID=A0AAN7TET8_9PEZI|nr:hypothetical protein LTR62_005329 [Meristemomyces frigidus]
MGDNMALLCMLHPGTPEKQKRCLDLLRRSAREYYRQPSAKCTTWSYFTPFPPPKPGKPANPAIGGMEIYTSKKALQSQVDDPAYFQSYHDTVKRENLYTKEEELVAWYRAAGFEARQGGGKEGEGVLISISRMQCKDRQKVVETITDFAKWVLANEPFVLTYALFTRPKAPNEVVLFVRYADGKGLKSHGEAPEHVEVVKKLSTLLTGSLGKGTTLWQEVGDSFASQADDASGSRSKL